MIFLDTSAIYALADAGDIRHEEAERLFVAAVQSSETIVTHSYVLVEAAALLHRRLGLKAALVFLREANRFTIVWVDEGMHAEAVDCMARDSSGKVSLVDCLSFIVMADRSIRSYIGFDKHFAGHGFVRYEP